MGMIADKVESLKGLQKAAEEACRAAIEAKDSIDGAVNWADLHCVEARWFVNHDGESGHSVYIEEASPEATQLRIFIRDFLEMRGFRDVEIYPEW